MQPIKFKGHNLVLAEDQPEYQPLPVCDERTVQGSMVCCYKLTLKERIKMLFSGKLFIRQLTFGYAYHPIAPMLDWKDGPCLHCGKPIGDHKAKDHYLCPPKLN